MPGLEQAPIATDFDFPLPPMDDMQDLVRMRFLYDCVEQFGDPSLGGVLEVGCYKGCSTVFLAQAALRRGFSGLTTIDLFTGTPSWGVTIDTWDEATARFAEYGLEGFVTPVRSDSRDYVCSEPLSVLHIDGDHAYGAITSDLGRFAPRVAPGGIIIVDDYDAGHGGVMRACHEFLALSQGFSIAAVNNSRRYFGSICLRRDAHPWE